MADPHDHQWTRPHHENWFVACSDPGLSAYYLGEAEMMALVLFVGAFGSLLCEFVVVNELSPS